MRADPLAGGGGCLAAHVLPRSVAGRVVEAQEPRWTDLVLLDVVQLAEPRGLLCLLLDVLEVVADPAPEVACGDRVVEAEHGGALHELLDHRGLDPAARIEHAHPSVVARDQRFLGGRERDVEAAVRVLAVDPQRTGDAERDLRHADEVLDVAGDRFRFDRVRRDVAQFDTGVIVGECSSQRGRRTAQSTIAISSARFMSYKEATGVPLHDNWRSRSDLLGDHVDGSARALLGAQPATLAEVEVDAEPLAGVELDHGVVGADAEAIVALEAVAA